MLLELGNQDFKLMQDNKSKYIGLKINGLSLVFFYSPECSYCHEFYPTFFHLSNSFNGCTFASINVSSNRHVVIESKDTIAPIKYVPYLLLYHNGKPIIRYDGLRSDPEIRKFLFEVANRLSIKNNFMKNNGQQQASQQGVISQPSVNEVPNYSLGKPVKGKKSNVCYLGYNEAYVGMSDNSKASKPGIGKKDCYKCFDNAYKKNINS
jgi:thioredoxin-like negative regulator of GroEL